jgi:hypothetical protein
LRPRFASGMSDQRRPIKSDFGRMARKYGLAVLHEHCRINLIELDDAYLAELIDVALGLMTVISKRANPCHRKP